MYTNHKISLDETLSISGLFIYALFKALSTNASPRTYIHTGKEFILTPN